MAPSPTRVPCPDCHPLLTRRQFVGAATATLAVTALPGASARASVNAGASETLAASLFKSLKDEQKKAVCFPFDHPLRSKVDNNWYIVDHKIADTFNPDQRDLIRQIFVSLHSEEYAPKVMSQVQHDNKGDGGFDSCAVAMFGEPGIGKFEWVFTGRHVTRRCDGDSVEGAAFGGPIFYGHAAKGFHEPADHAGNVYWYQARRANEVFQALDGKQRRLALRQDPREEKHTDTVKLPANKSEMHGVPCSDLSADQKELVRKTMSDLLAPFRKPDADEAMKVIEAAGGIDALHLAFYKNMDIGNDGVWDVWQISGPSTVWFFRGAPHVHTWVNIRRPA